MRREIAAAAWGRISAPPASSGSPALIFTDPETFDLVPLALRRGRAVAVDDDGPQAAGLEEALEITRDYLGRFV